MRVGRSGPPKVKILAVENALGGRPKWEGIFIYVPATDEFVCGACISDDYNMEDPDTQIWEEGSTGWTSPVVCSRCKLSMSIFIDGKEQEKEILNMNKNTFEQELENIENSFDFKNMLEHSPRLSELYKSNSREVLLHYHAFFIVVASKMFDNPLVSSGYLLSTVEFPHQLNAAIAEAKSTWGPR